MKKKSLLIILLSVFLLTIIVQKTYAYYISRTNITVSSTSSNVICDAEIQSVNNNEKGLFGYSEFKIVVKNNKDNKLTGEPFNYTLKVEDFSGSSAYYGYNNEFDSSLTIDGSLSNDTNKSDSYIIQVKSLSGLSENINYKVTLDCVQDY